MSRSASRASKAPASHAPGSTIRARRNPLARLEDRVEGVSDPVALAGEVLRVAGFALDEPPNVLAVASALGVEVRQQALGSLGASSVLRGDTTFIVIEETLSTLEKRAAIAEGLAVLVRLLAGHEPAALEPVANAALTLAVADELLAPSAAVRAATNGAGDLGGAKTLATAFAVTKITWSRRLAAVRGAA